MAGVMLRSSHSPVLGEFSVVKYAQASLKVRSCLDETAKSVFGSIPRPSVRNSNSGITTDCDLCGSKIATQGYGQHLRHSARSRYVESPTGWLSDDMAVVQEAPDGLDRIRASSHWTFPGVPYGHSTLVSIWPDDWLVSFIPVKLVFVWRARFFAAS
jgi:hypothetical protein